MRQPLKECAVSHPLAFSDGRCKIEATIVTKSNTWNNHLISFSSNSIHALCDTSELTEGISQDDWSSLTDGAFYDDYRSTPFVLNRNSGWVAGPKDRLLFWVPPASRDLFHNSETVIVIPRGCPELDLSRMAHGRHWQKCREM
jgi:hypothetical protein